MWKKILLAVGILIIIVMGFGCIKAFSFHSSLKFKTHEISGTYDKVVINIDTDNLLIYPSNHTTPRVECYENEKKFYEVKVEDNTLFITSKDNRKFYDRLISFGSKDIKLHLPNSTIELLDINASTCDITVYTGLTINNLDIENSTGDIKIKSNILNSLTIDNSTGDITINNCTAMGDIKLETSTGDINIFNTNAKKLNIEVSTGDTNLSNVILSGDFTMEGSTGDLVLDGFDASNINVSLSTGNVIGTILTHKFFIAKSSTGDVEVPETRDGGECRITLSTGDILITYKS